MGCSLIKKAVMGTALGAGALYLVFGTSAPSYVKTAFHKVRDNAKGAVPVQFEIDRAREELANLEPAIHEGIAEWARERVEVATLEKEIAKTKENLAAEKTAMKTLRNAIDTGDYRLAGSLTYTEDEVKSDLARRLDSYKLNSKLIESKEGTLKAKKQVLAAAKDKLDQMKTAKKALSTKIDGIEARLRMIETTQATREFNFDDTALARVKQTVADLDKRLDVLSLQAEMEGKYSTTGVPISLEPGRDVLKEVDAELGAPAKKASDKSL